MNEVCKCATKEQEREVIRKIQKLVDSLGEGSYLSAAMDGVLELADINIRDDAAYSWKQGKELVDKELATVKEELKKALSDLHTAKSYTGTLQEELKERRRECSELRMKREHAEELIALVRCQREQAEENATDAAYYMATGIMMNSENVKQFVPKWEVAQNRVAKCKELEKMLQKYLVKNDEEEK